MSKTVIKSKNDINEAILSAAGKAVADGKNLQHKIIPPES